MNKENKQTEKRSSLLKRIFNIRQWSDWYRVKAGARYFWTSASKLSQADRQRQVEDFKHAQLRLGLSDEALARRGLYLRRLSYFMLFLSASFLIIGHSHIFLIKSAVVIADINSFIFLPRSDIFYLSFS